MSVSDALRKAMKARGEGIREIARATGVEPSVISRFLRGAGLRSENLDALAGHCGLKLMNTAGRRPRKGR